MKGHCHGNKHKAVTIMKMLWSCWLRACADQLRFKAQKRKEQQAALAAAARASGAELLLQGGKGDPPDVCLDVSRLRSPGGLPPPPEVHDPSAHGMQQQMQGRLPCSLYLALCTHFTAQVSVCLRQHVLVRVTHNAVDVSVHALHAQCVHVLTCTRGVVISCKVLDALPIAVRALA